MAYYRAQIPQVFIAITNQTHVANELVYGIIEHNPTIKHDNILELIWYNPYINDTCTVDVAT